MSTQFIRYLGDVGYKLVAIGRDRWRVDACRGHRFTYAPQLVLPPQVFDEYVAQIKQEGSDTASGLSVWSLIDVHLDESILSPTALENTTEVGVRRVRGRAEWYTTLAHPDWFPPAEGVSPAEAGRTMPGDDV